MQTQSKLWYLSQIDLFKAMSPVEMKQMESMTEMQEVPKWNPIYLPGDKADAIFLLKRGRVRISRLSEQGKQITLSILEPGSIFGELALIEANTQHDNIAEAVEETLLCLIERQDFENFLKQHAEMSLKVTKWMGLRLRQIENRVEDLVFKSAEVRLYELLQRLSQDYPKPVEDGVLINITLTQQELGELTNLARPTVTDLLQRLIDKGLIRKQKRKIVLLQADTLKISQAAQPGKLISVNNS